MNLKFAYREFYLLNVQLIKSVCNRIFCRNQQTFMKVYYICGTLVCSLATCFRSLFFHTTSSLACSARTRPNFCSHYINTNIVRSLEAVARSICHNIEFIDHRKINCRRAWRVTGLHGSWCSAPGGWSHEGCDSGALHAIFQSSYRCTLYRANAVQY